MNGTPFFNFEIPLMLVAIKSTIMTTEKAVRKTAYGRSRLKRPGVEDATIQLSLDAKFCKN
jgi:hypothetical protein